MSKHRRDSVNGKMNVIGRFSDWGLKKKSGKGFLRPKSINSVQVPPDELDDIELLESIVLELIDFDWEGFEKQRMQSLFYRRRQQRTNIRRSQFKEMFVDGGAVQCVDISDEENSDNESVNSKVNVHRFKSEEFIYQLSNDGKSKLKFIMQFAQSGNTIAATSTLRDLSPQDRVRIRNSIHHARLSKLYSKGKRRSTMMSLKSKGSALSRGARSSLVKRHQKDNLEDRFAKMKGYRNREHMQKSLERFRGFEELRDETQISLMAEENGYKASGPVIDMIENDSTQVDYGTGVYFSDSDDDKEEKELEEFMKLDDDNLEELLNRWEVESHPESEEEVEPKTSKALSKRKAARKQRAIRNGWGQRQYETTKAFLNQKLQPKDSLTARHLEVFHSGE